MEQIHIVRPHIEATPRRWDLVEAEFLRKIKIALGNMSQWDMYIETSTNSVLIALPRKGIERFELPVHPHDMHQAFAGIFQWDAENLCDFINAQLGYETKELGRYLPEFTQEYKLPND